MSRDFSTLFQLGLDVSCFVFCSVFFFVVALFRLRVVARLGTVLCPGLEFGARGSRAPHVVPRIVGPPQLP